MAIERTGAAPVAPAPDAAQALRLLELLRHDDVDGAIEAGLAGFAPLAALCDSDNRMLADARDRLLAAWAARARHRARALRLERIAHERTQARTTRADAGTGPAATRQGAHAATAPADPPRPALPAAAAAALARARARASGSTP